MRCADRYDFGVSSHAPVVRCRRTSNACVLQVCRDGARCKRTQWKSRRLSSCSTRCSGFFDNRLFPQLCAPTRDTGLSSEPFDWILEPLRAQGYFKVQLSDEEYHLMSKLFECSRNFFSQSMGYKTSYKFFPIPGGYLTPYPGANETFELRRGLCRCPPELSGQAMSAFQLLEQLAKKVCREVGHDIGADLAAMPSDTSATLRCIHYDEPHKSVGLVDDFSSRTSANAPLLKGSAVRIVKLEGVHRMLNGLQGTVAFSDKDGVVVSIPSAPKEVFKCINTIDGCIRVDFANLRLIRSNVPGVYPAHTDSSLVTVAPRSSAAGLELKDLQTGEWFRIEERMKPNEVLVFVGDPLDYASAHRYQALMHRPVVPAVGGPVPPTTRADGCIEHRVSTPFFLYPSETAPLAPGGKLPTLTFDKIQGNDGGCRDNFPWKKQSCYYSEMVYSQVAPGDS